MTLIVVHPEFPWVHPEERDPEDPWLNHRIEETLKRIIAAATRAVKTSEPVLVIPFAPLEGTPAEHLKRFNVAPVGLSPKEANEWISPWLGRKNRVGGFWLNRCVRDLVRTNPALQTAPKLGLVHPDQCRKPR